MKMTKKVLLLIGTGIIAFAMFAGCASSGGKTAAPAGKCGGYCGGKGPQKQITITGIPNDYNTRFGGVLVEDNAGKTVGYSFVNITGSSITAQLLCWEDDLPFTKDGGYKTYFLIYTDAQAAAAGNTLWRGVMLQPLQLTDKTSAAFSAFIAAN